jgi:hypothetical protein
MFVRDFPENSYICSTYSVPKSTYSVPKKKNETKLKPKLC